MNMNKLKTRDKYCVELPFKIIYLVFAFFTYCNLTYNRPIMSIMVDLVLLTGAIVVLFRVLMLKGYLQTKGIIFLILFCVSYIVSMVANYQYGISDNFKYLIWTGFHLFVFFMCDVRRKIKDYKKEFDVISWVFVFRSFVLVFGSLVMYYMGISIEAYDQQDGVLLAGVVWGRLWGTFTDPNYGSVFATLAAVFSYYKIKYIKKKVVKVLLGFNILSDFLYIALSDSRTGIVCLFSCTFVYAILMKIKVGKKIYVGIVISTLIFSIGMATIPVLLKNVNNNIISAEQGVTENEEAEEKGKDELLIGREADLEGNFSNRRTDIWMSALEIFKTKPIIGVSFFNLVPYTEENLPETYLVNNDLGVFNNFHNMPLNLLAGQGIVGFGIMMAFGIIIVMYVFRKWLDNEYDMYEYKVVLITGIIASLECSMFVTDVLYTNSPMSVMFWLLLGYLVHYTMQVSETMKKCEIEEKNEGYNYNCNTSI